MRQGILGLCLLLALGLLALREVRREAPSRRVEPEAANACVALHQFYTFLCDHSAARNSPFPVTLSEIPEWETYVAHMADSALRAHLRKLRYHYPLPDRTNGQEMASIDLGGSRAVLTSGGSTFLLRKK